MYEKTKCYQITLSRVIEYTTYYYFYYYYFYYYYYY